MPQPNTVVGCGYEQPKFLEGAPDHMARSTMLEPGVFRKADPLLPLLKKRGSDTRKFNRGGGDCVSARMLHTLIDCRGKNET